MATIDQNYPSTQLASGTVKSLFTYSSIQGVMPFYKLRAGNTPDIYILWHILKMLETILT